MQIYKKEKDIIKILFIYNLILLLFYILKT